jgi:uncharacterized protein
MQRTMKHLINWVEIPAIDLTRAKEFYSTILDGVTFQDMNVDGMEFALFPSEDKFNTGALAKSQYHKPSSDGISIYLDGGKDMDNILGRIENAGGEIIMPKTYTGKEAGYVGMFIDSEGNKIGLQHL